MWIAGERRASNINVSLRTFYHNTYGGSHEKPALYSGTYSASGTHWKHILSPMDLIYIFKCNGGNGANYSGWYRDFRVYRLQFKAIQYNDQHDTFENLPKTLPYTSSTVPEHNRVASTHRNVNTVDRNQ